MGVFFGLCVQDGDLLLKEVPALPVLVDVRGPHYSLFELFKDVLILGEDDYLAVLAAEVLRDEGLLTHLDLGLGLGVFYLLDLGYLLDLRGVLP